MTDIRAFLKSYDGPVLRLMEVCGTHTAEISRCGIPSLLSPKIRLISGPGCPVCVTVTAYIDRLIELSLTPGCLVITFGDLLRVPGSSQSLNDARAQGGRVKMVYSPLESLRLARENPGLQCVFAAVGFETTAPVYAALLREAAEAGVTNLRLLTSLKTMPPVIDWVCRTQKKVDGFLAPGHVAVITGSRAFVPLAEKYGIPFVVAGFTGEQLLGAIYALARLQGQGKVLNLYRSAVTEEGNREALRSVEKFFRPCGAAWRGMGVIPDSGLALREEYALFDAGGAELLEDRAQNSACRCAEILTGAAEPQDCPLFGRVCTPETPQGACMVSAEGSCFHRFSERSR